MIKPFKAQAVVDNQPECERTLRWRSWSNALLSRFSAIRTSATTAMIVAQSAVMQELHQGQNTKEEHDREREANDVLQLDRRVRVAL